MKTRCIVCDEKEFGIIEEEMPKISDDQALVKTIRSLPSVGTEIASQKSLKPGTKKTGTGYANVGRIVEVGKNVRRHRIGDCVMTFANHRDYFILDPSEKPVHPWPMTHPDSNMIFKVPEEITCEEATFTVIASVALYFAEKAEITIGRTVVVLGLGTVGLLTCQFARLAGAMTVIGVDIDESRFALAHEIGVDHTIQPAQDKELHGILNSRIVGSAPPIYIEASGSLKAVRWAVDSAGIVPGSTVILGGFYRDDLSLPIGILQRETRVIGASQPKLPEQPVFSMPYNRQFNWHYIWHQIAKKRLIVNKLYDGLVTPDEAVEFYNAALTGRPHLKQPLITWE